MITGKPLFPGRNVAHQLDLVTDLLGSPSAETIARVCLKSFFFNLYSNFYRVFSFWLTSTINNLQIRNEKARRYLLSMPKKTPTQFSQKFPNADPLALRLLEKLIAFDPADRISAEEISISKTLCFSCN